MCYCANCKLQHTHIHGCLFSTTYTHTSHTCTRGVFAIGNAYRRTCDLCNHQCTSPWQPLHVGSSLHSRQPVWVQHEAYIHCKACAIHASTKHAQHMPLHHTPCPRLVVSHIRKVQAFRAGNQCSMPMGVPQKRMQGPLMCREPPELRNHLPSGADKDYSPCSMVARCITRPPQNCEHVPMGAPFDLGQRASKVDRQGCVVGGVVQQAQPVRGRRERRHEGVGRQEEVMNVRSMGLCRVHRHTPCITAGAGQCWVCELLCGCCSATSSGCPVNGGQRCSGRLALPCWVHVGVCVCIMLCSTHA